MADRSRKGSTPGEVRCGLGARRDWLSCAFDGIISLPVAYPQLPPPAASSLQAPARFGVFADDEFLSFQP